MKALDLFETYIDKADYFVCEHSGSNYQFSTGILFNPEKCIQLIRMPELITVDSDPVTGRWPRFRVNFLTNKVPPSVDEGNDYCIFTFYGEDSQLVFQFYDLHAGKRYERI